MGQVPDRRALIGANGEQTTVVPHRRPLVFGGFARRKGERPVLEGRIDLISEQFIVLFNHDLPIFADLGASVAGHVQYVVDPESGPRCAAFVHNRYWPAASPRGGRPRPGRRCMAFENCPANARRRIPEVDFRCPPQTASVAPSGLQASSSASVRQREGSDERARVPVQNPTHGRLRPIVNPGDLGAVGTEGQGSHASGPAPDELTAGQIVIKNFAIAAHDDAAAVRAESNAMCRRHPEQRARRGVRSTSQTVRPTGGSLRSRQVAAVGAEVEEPDVVNGRCLERGDFVVVATSGGQ